MADLCARHHVLVVSDEIHCDIIAPGREYIPFLRSQTNLNNSITCIAPTKAFNLAGLQSACIVVENEVIRQKVNRGINTDEVAEPNSFAITAAMSAFNYGEKWLDELNIYIQNNKQIACQYIEENLPMLHVVYSEATYLLWIDCSKVTDDSVELVEAIKKKTGLYLSDGYEYGENGKAFVRMNVACPQMRLMDGLKRLREGVIDYQQNMK
ncbi:MAG: aminotransferase class I/II-fold pyridoxal phosphate-dependent enzyme [Longibaculum sp.]